MGREWGQVTGHSSRVLVGRGKQGGRREGNLTPLPGSKGGDRKDGGGRLSGSIRQSGHGNLAKHTTITISIVNRMATTATARTN